MARKMWRPFTRAWRGRLCALGLLVALTSLLVSLALGAGAVGAVTAIRDATSPIAEQPTYIVVTRLAADPDLQDAQVRAVIDDELSVPFTVERSEIASPGDTAFAQWEVEIPAVNPEDVAALVDAGDRIRLALRDTSAVVRGIQVDDALTPQLAPIAETLPSLRNLTLIPSVLLFLIGMVLVVQVAVTLPRSRSDALRIMDARGASRPHIALHAAAEALVAGGGGAIIGVVLARLALQPWGGGPLVLQAAGGTAFVLALAVASAIDSVRASHRARRDVRLTKAALLLVVAVLTAATMWRLLRSGVDAISAPALGLATLTGVLISLVIVTPLGGALAGVSSRTRGLILPLSFRRAARRQAASAPAALLVALAVASVMLAAGFGGTERAVREQDIALERGSDLRVQLPAQIAGQPSTPITPFAEIDGAAGAIGVRVATGAIDMIPTTVVIVPAEGAGAVLGVEVEQLVQIDTGSVPAIASPAVVDLLALELGDTFGVTLDGPTSNAELVGISSEIPAAGGAMAIMVDQSRLSEYLRAQGVEPYGASEVWIALDGTREAGAVAQDALALEPGATLVETQPNRTIAAGTMRLAFWAVAGAAIGLALVGVASLRLSVSGVQAREDLALRSLGMGARAIRTAQRVELYARAIPAAVGGALVGGALAAYVLPVLVALASGSARQPVLAFEALPLAVGIGALALVLVVAAHLGRRP